MTPLIIGATYRPVKLLKDQPEPRRFILQEIWTKTNTVLIQYEDSTLEEVSSWVVEYYCTMEGA
jgi:hypothetical protein